MNKIKSIIGIISSFFFASLLTIVLSGTAYAVTVNMEIGSIVMRSNGEMLIDWRVIGASDQDHGPWTQTTLSRNPQNTKEYLSAVSIDALLGNNFSATINDNGEAVVTLSNGYGGDTSVNEKNLGSFTYNGNSTQRLTQKPVTEDVYKAMQKYLAEGMSQQEAQKKAEEELKKKAEEAAGGGSSGSSCAGTTTSVISCDSESNGIQAMLLQFTNFFFAGVGVLCVIGVVLGGIVYITAGGDTGRTKQGITYIVNSVIGLVIFIFLFMLLNFLVPGGFFNNAGFDVEQSGTDAPDTSTPICTGPTCMTAE